MLKLRTPLNLKKSSWEINHLDSITGMGSCFVNNVGEYFQKYKFLNQINPHGIIYNPISLTKSIRSILQNQAITIDDLIRDKGLWHSLNHHSRFSGLTAERVVQSINQSTEQAHQLLLQSNYLVLTLGTAYLYHHKSTEQVVANCHKISSTQFDKVLAKLDDILVELADTLSILKDKIPSINTVITVSPVRHIKDGIVENQRSKSTLLLAAHELADSYDFVEYFPSYEIVLDDLRDYRFYQENLVHPNHLAVQYIWSFFRQTYFSKSTNQLIDKLNKIHQAMEHKPFHPNSLAHQIFVQKQIEKINDLSKAYPFIDLSEEQRWFASILQSKRSV